MNIALIGDLEDLCLNYIKWLLEKMSIPYLLLSESNYGIDWSIHYSDIRISEGFIRYHDKTIKIGDIYGFFVRFNPNPDMPLSISLPPLYREGFAQERRLFINYFLNNVKGVVINKPYAGVSNGSKPFQMGKLKRFGFRVPEWIVTNDYAAAEKFCEKHKKSGVVIKSCSGLRSHVRQVDETILDNIKKGTSPVILQEYIKGYEVRVHTVGNKTFPTKIISPNTDYRFESNNCQYSITELPFNIEQACINFALHENMVLAGFDFRVNEDNWYCLEMNPVPTFLPYEMSTGQEIGKAIIDALFENVHRYSISLR